MLKIIVKFFFMNCFSSVQLFSRGLGGEEEDEDEGELRFEDLDLKDDVDVGIHGGLDDADSSFFVGGGGEGEREGGGGAAAEAGEQQQGRKFLISVKFALNILQEWL